MTPRQVRSLVPVSSTGHDLTFVPAPSAPRGTGRSRAVLLCHGFTSTPASLRLWAQQLADRGYHVSVPRLPGHGTAWQEMNVTEWTDWYHRLEQEYCLLRSRHDVVGLGGLSMGGGLAVRLALEHPEVPALVLVNPSLATYDRTYRLLPLLSRVVPSIDGVGGDIQRPGKWEQSYDRTPLRAANSMRRMWADVVRRLGDLHTPTLVFRSEVDHVVDDATVELLRPLPVVTVRMLRDSWHVATLDHDAERIGTESAGFYDQHTC